MSRRRFTKLEAELLLASAAAIPASWLTLLFFGPWSQHIPSFEGVGWFIRPLALYVAQTGLWTTMALIWGILIVFACMRAYKHYAREPATVQD